MKKVVFLSSILAGLMLFSVGCTPKTAGQDSSYLNKNRGAAGAQISKAEAEQYKRQQEITANEVKLENMKRRQKTDAIKEGSEAASSASDAIQGGVGAIQSLKNMFGW